MSLVGTLLPGAVPARRGSDGVNNIVHSMNISLIHVVFCIAIASRNHVRACLLSSALVDINLTIFRGVIYLICEPLLPRPHRMNDIVHSLSISKG